MSYVRGLCAIVCGCILVSDAAAEDWHNWRGPHQNGTAAAGSYPTSWSNTEHIAWKYPLPGRGASTPAVAGDHIFLTYVQDDTNVGICLNRAGQARWQVELGESREERHKKASGANSSPITDGERVYFYFKSGDLGCFDFNGNKLWQVNLQSMFGKDTLWWDMGTSPVLTKDHVIVSCLQSGDSYIAAFAKDSGKVVWKQSREMNAPNESNQSYTTPLVLQRDDREIIIVAGADWVTCHDASDGTEIWRVGGLNPKQEQFFRSISSPVANDSRVYVPYARGASLTAIRLGGTGDVTDSHVEWTVEKYAADVPTPAISGKRIYVCADKTSAFCLDVETGELIWEETLERNNNAYSSSPVVAGGHVYLTREDGTTFVIEDSNTFKIIAENRLGESVMATPVFVDGRIYLRTYENLYCVGEQAR